MKLFFKLNLFFSLTLHVLSLSKRVSEKGLDCFLPFTYNGRIYSDCAFSRIFQFFPIFNNIFSLKISFLEEYQKEWCFLDKTYTTWGFCQSPQIKEPPFMIKNLLSDKKTYFCLFGTSNNSSEELLAIDCLQGGLEEGKMLFSWNLGNNEIISLENKKKICVKNNSELKFCLPK